MDILIVGLGVNETVLQFLSPQFMQFVSAIFEINAAKTQPSQCRALAKSFSEVF